MLLGGGILSVVLLAAGVLYWLKKINSDPVSPASEVTEDPREAAQAKARLSAITGLAPPEPVPVDPTAPPGPPSPATIPPLSEPLSEDPPLSLSSSQPALSSGGESVLTDYARGDGQGIEEIEKMLEKDPENLQLLDWLAFLYYSNDQTEKAIDAYTRIISIDPSNPTQHYYLANSFYKANRIDEALSHWQTVLSLDPNGKMAEKAREKLERVGTAVGT